MPRAPLDVFTRSITFVSSRGLFARGGAFVERNRTMSILGSPPDFDFSLSSTLARNWTVVVARGVLGLCHRLDRVSFPGSDAVVARRPVRGLSDYRWNLAIVAAVRAASKHERWGSLTFEGIVGIVAGISATALPGLTVLVFVGSRGLGPSFGGVGTSRGLNLATDHGRWWPAFGGIISIIFGIVLVAAPTSVPWW